jgi:hypothetical protein
VEPPLVEYAGGHLAACHHPRNVTAQEIAAVTRSDASPLASGDELPQANGAGDAQPAAAATLARPDTAPGVDDQPDADADASAPALPEQS